MSSKWKILQQKELFSSKYFKLRSDRCQLPSGKVMPNYYVFEFLDWVNVIPITSEGKYVLIDQYRHASGDHFLEIPGGTMEPDEGETPELAGKRELLEETGYTSDQVKYLGFHNPNPALQNNKVHTFLALNCIKSQDPQLDPYEDLTVRLTDPSDFFSMIKNGGFKHSIIAASILLALPYLKEV